MTNGGGPHGHGKKGAGKSRPAQTATTLDKKTLVPNKLVKKKKKKA